MWAIINQKITYKKFATEIENHYLYRDSFVVIEPYRCGCCGEVFETIEIPLPKELPREYENGNDSINSENN